MHWDSICLFVCVCVYWLPLQVICVAVPFHSGLQRELGDHHGLTAGTSPQKVPFLDVLGVYTLADSSGLSANEGAGV